jgi:predicted transposase YdaD
MKPAGYEFQSDFAKRYVAQGRQEGREEGRVEGREEGRVEGRAALVIRQLTLRFGPVADEVRARIARATISELDDIGERLLTAPTLQEALGPHYGRDI